MDPDIKTRFQNKCLTCLNPYLSDQMTPKFVLALILTVDRRQSFIFKGLVDYGFFKGVLIANLHLRYQWPFFVNEAKKIIMFPFIYLDTENVESWFARTPNWSEWQVLAFDGSIEEIDIKCTRFNLR